ncbi:methyl-accepting chemotaxis protein [Candidatus Vampirococcus lugosii]|uniref:Chemotaxis protein n=1 Tax=Candidatus Vampirococcus lugosii TaxID=2789015 RepID=A0ABS5QMQ8_9BACT|nr:chemotaxis protein [Candidatus Vampirococcus lugosii]
MVNNFSVNLFNGSKKLKGELLELRETNGQLIEYIEKNLGLLKKQVIELASVTSNIGNIKTTMFEKINNLNDIIQRLDKVVSQVQKLSDNAQGPEAIINNALEALENSSIDTDEVVENIKYLISDILSLEEKINIHNYNAQEAKSLTGNISEISNQSNILTINAQIESARAGVVGNAFSVVAEEIKSLSKKTENTSKKTGDIINDLIEKSESLKEIIKNMAQKSNNSNQGVENILNNISKAVGATKDAKGGLELLQKTVEIVQNQLDNTMKELEETGYDLDNSNKSLDSAYSHLDESLIICEKQMQLGINYNLNIDEGKMAEIASQTADYYSKMFEEIIDKGKTVKKLKLDLNGNLVELVGIITLEELFDEKFIEIPGTNPVQYITGFTGLTDEFQKIQEKILEEDETGKIIFCAPVFKKDGYLPTHNKKFSHPQRKSNTKSDINRNTANSRNRRKFTDRVGLKAASNNEEKKLVQIYIREMGGKTIPMLDISSPIYVKGEHWGGFRMGVKFE